MRISIINNGNLIKYDLTYDAEKMREFINEIIDKYSDKEEETKLVSSQKELNNLGDEVRNMELLSSNRRDGKKEYAYQRFYYPEIYYHIQEILSQENVDLSKLTRYIDPYDPVDYNDLKRYKEDRSPKIAATFELLDSRMFFGRRDKKRSDEDIIKAYIDNVIRKRRRQKECISTFFNMLSYTKVNDNERATPKDIATAQINSTILNQLNRNINLDQESKRVR